MALGHWLKDYIGPRGSENSGVDIPTPTVADAGKSIVVNEEGQYELAESSGGSGVLVVKPVSVENNVTTYNCTYRQLFEALEGQGARFCNTLQREFMSQPIVEIDSEHEGVTIFSYGVGDTTNWRTFAVDNSDDLDAVMTLTNSPS